LVQAVHSFEEEGPVFVEADEVVLVDFREADQEVVGFVREADDPEAAVHRCLQMGARALRLANVSTETAIVDKAFDAMTTEFDGKVEGAVDRIVKAGESLLSEEDGELAQALAGWQAEVESMLNSTFDPDSKRSVLSKLETILEEARERQVQSVRQIINPDDPESPMGRMSHAFKEQFGQVLGALAEVSEKVAVTKAEAQIIELTAGKGFSFEDLLHSSLIEVVSVHGDVSDQVGNTSGRLGNKVGDEVVELNDEDTRGASVRYVLEAKDRKLGLKASLGELEKAMENREADAGILVFSRQDLAPTQGPFQPFGDKAIVVLDKDEGDLSALRLACCWARWVVQRKLSSVEDAVDIDRVEALIEDGRRALTRISNVRRAHSAARNKIQEAAGQVDGLGSELDEIFSQLCEEIRR
jgi:hypothetical protein